ncbi:MAG: histidine--tRNA ligase [Phycisphaerales bacterium]|nr:histidine--tRNA ligase [Hyphomonadaceae bacterium]
MSTESKLVTPERPRGFADKLGDDAGAEERIVAAVGRVYEKWGFDRLETPAIEYTGALGKFLPDTDRPNEGVFSFQDDERWLSLRYDLTAPLARFAAENRDALPKPFRRWQSGPVWRNEKPGPGRFRQFVQCDADTVGSDNPASDAEMIAMAGEALEAIGVARDGYQFKINSRRILNGVLLGIGLGAEDKARLTVMRAIDKLDRIGVEGVAALLGKGRKDESGDFTLGADLDPASVKKVIDFVTLPTDSRAAVLSGLERIVGDNDEGRAGLVELTGIDAVLTALGVDDMRARIDPSVVRGLEYYTGAVYEAELTAPVEDDTGRLVRFGSVGGGGRYDDLIARFTGERVPATGFSIGVSRLVAAQKALGLGGAGRADPLVIVLAMDRDRMGDYFAIANELRGGGVRAEVYLGGAGMKAQLKYADKRGASIAVIQGGDELAKGIVTLKDLKLGAAVASKLGEDREAYAKAREQVQQEIPRAQVVAAVQQMLAR